MTLNPVPADEVTLAELLRDGLFIDGDWVESKDQDPLGEVRLIQLADVGDGVFRDRSARFLTREKAAELRCTFLEPGDVLVARMPDPLGRACIFPGVGQPAVTVVDVCILRPNPERVRSAWLVNAINSPRFRTSMQEFVRGTTRQRISRGNLGSLVLAVPSVVEQTSVASVLDLVESRRSSASVHVSASRQVIDRFRQTVLAAACCGDLTEDWRAANRWSVPLIPETAGRKKSSRFEEPVDLELPSLPESYLGTTVGAVAARLEYGTSKRCSTDPRGVPILRMGNIQGGRLDLDNLKFCPLDDEIERLVLQDGDLLFNRTNSPELVGKSAVFHADARMSFASYLIRVRFDETVAHPDYVNYWINSAWGRAWARLVKSDGVSQSNINGTKLAIMPLPLPPIEEQQEIVRRASRLLVLADGLASRVDRVQGRVDYVARAVLARAFRRELVDSSVIDDREAS